MYIIINIVKIICTASQINSICIVFNKQIYIKNKRLTVKCLKDNTA